MMYPPITQIALESRFTVMSRQVLIQLKATNLIPAISRKIGLPPPGLGNCRARCSARCHVPCSSPRLRSGSCLWLRQGPHPPAASCLSATCRWPAALSDQYCLRSRYDITLRPIRRVAARRPRSSAFPPVSTAGHMAVVAAGPRPLLSRVPRGHIPAKYTPAHLRHKGGHNKQPPPMSSRIKPGGNNGVGASSRARQGAAAVQRLIVCTPPNSSP